MFCPKCGAKNEDNAANCVACNEPLKVAAASGFQTDKAAEQVKLAMNDAMSTVKSLGIDPVGGLLNAYQALGKARALGVGVAFGLVFALCFVLISYKTLQHVPGLDGLGGFIKLMVVGFTPFVSLSIACRAGVKVGQGKGTFDSGCFISGVALLPLGLVSLVAVLIGYGNLEITFILSTISVCLTVMVLFAGLTRIAELTDKAASYTVPLMLIGSVWIAKVILTTLFF